MSHHHPRPMRCTRTWPTSSAPGRPRRMRGACVCRRCPVPSAAVWASVGARARGVGTGMTPYHTHTPALPQLHGRRDAAGCWSPPHGKGSGVHVQGADVTLLTRYGLHACTVQRACLPSASPLWSRRCFIVLTPSRRRRFPLLSSRHYRLKTFAKRIFPRCRALLSGRGV